MKGIIEGMLSIIVMILLLKALFPDILERIVGTALLAIFVGVVLVIIGSAIWFFINRD